MLKLDTSKRMTDKRLGYLDEAVVRLIVFRVSDMYGRSIDDIIEGSRKTIVSYFNRERDLWMPPLFEVFSEPVTWQAFKA